MWLSDGKMEDKVGPMLEGETQVDMEPTDERINQPTKELYNYLIRASIN